MQPVNFQMPWRLGSERWWWWWWWWWWMDLKSWQIIFCGWENQSFNFGGSEARDNTSTATTKHPHNRPPQRQIPGILIKPPSDDLHPLNCISYPQIRSPEGDTNKRRDGEGRSSESFQGGSFNQKRHQQQEEIVPFLCRPKETR